MKQKTSEFFQFVASDVENIVAMLIGISAVTGTLFMFYATGTGLLHTAGWAQIWRVLIVLAVLPSGLAGGLLFTALLAGTESIPGVHQRWLYWKENGGVTRMN